MTITLHWWYIPILLFILPFVVAWIVEKFRPIDAFDIGGALIMMGVFAGCWLCALGILIGKWAF